MLRFARIALAAGAIALSCCSATDVVAKRAGNGCPSDDGGCEDPPNAQCRARGCAALATRSTLCRGGQGQVQAGDSCSGAGNAVQVSRFALCTCSDLITTAPLSVDAFRGTLGQSAPGAARLGVNGNLMLNGPASVDGNISVAGQSSVTPMLDSATAIVKAASPCACAAENLLDIAALVNARVSDNDNAAAGVRSEQLNGFTGRQELSLDCGRYFFTRLKGDQPIAIRTRGDVAIFVASNIELNESLSIETETGGTVSLFVAGDMRIGGSFALGGDPNGKSRASLYLASAGTLEIAGSTEVAGLLYAPRAELVTLGTFQLYGSLFVRRAVPAGEMHLHYDTLAALAPNCEPLP